MNLGPSISANRQHYSDQEYKAAMETIARLERLLKEKDEKLKIALGMLREYNRVSRLSKVEKEKLLNQVI